LFTADVNVDDEIFVEVDVVRRTTSLIKALYAMA